MIYNKNLEENLKDYKIRLCKNKDIYGLTFQDIANLINKESGENKSESVYRKWWTAYNEGYQDAERNSLDNDDIIKEYEEKRIEAEKAKYRFFDQRNSYNKIVREQARFEELKDIVKTYLDNMEPYSGKMYTEDIDFDNDMIVCLDDIHYGANIDNYWNKYNSDIAKYRMDKYLEEIRKIKYTNNCQNCFVFNNGDSISGQIHNQIAVTNRENLVEQIMGVSELISWFLSELSNIFDNVYYASVSGNHSRIAPKKEALKDERLDNLIPWYVKSRVSNIDNIFVIDNDIDSTFNVVNIRGLNYLNIHGDYDNFSNVHKVIAMSRKPIYCVHMGHLHHNKTETIGEYKVIQSGSFQGVDEFCIEKRILGRAEQLVCVCNKDGIVCTYDVGLQ